MPLFKDRYRLSEQRCCNCLAILEKDSGEVVGTCYRDKNWDPVPRVLFRRACYHCLFNGIPYSEAYPCFLMLWSSDFGVLCKYKHIQRVTDDGAPLKSYPMRVLYDKETPPFDSFQEDVYSWRFGEVESQELLSSDDDSCTLDSESLSDWLSDDDDLEADPDFIFTGDKKQ